MPRRKFTVIALSFLMMLLSVSPVYAGTWTEHDDGTWTYLNDDGESVVGWIEDGDNPVGWFKEKDAGITLTKTASWHLIPGLIITM